MRSNNPEDYGMNLPTAMVIGSFTAIAWVNTIELQIRIWVGFKRYTGLYFWSLLLSSWGCAIHPLAFVMLDFDVWTNAHIAGVIIGVSWWCMVTGQALVLYSRLHLVVRDKRKIRWVLIMIITNFCILHIPIMIISQTAYTTIPSAPHWLAVYKVYEKVQMTGFTIQETIISGLYLWETRKILQPGKVFQKARTRSVFHHLIWVNVAIITLDMALLATEYANLFSIQTVFKAAIYSLKLRFEFVVLNQLMDIVQGRASAFDLSAGAGASHGYGTQRSGAGGARKTPIPLESMNSRDGGVGRTRDGVNGYSVSASKDISSPIGRPNVDGVLRTTEVRVHHASSNALVGEEDEREYGGRYANVMPGVAVTETEGDGRALSPTSSEVEFAGKGA